ncbi:ribosome biogenesis protein ERB1 [Gaeumannomyces tritici R3-111a-1]|uniref:Ribosome biogenesis protein ERB1 n=1 Tax=Gaeumannomyces tritici (strain R3-111a-1) TaxID=644352 RepID=J3NXM9_GAET3|nr:ribosome biogenesis protein ERB1 [Gaeumannomyces tritici R3-111a-1]EJT76111.1 ribosome biogenesis protein ERB1 [Gaeumannomyces tritici R3-111a-1]
MGPQLASRKRKLPSKAVEESDDEIIDGLLDGALSQSEDDDEADESEPGEGEGEDDEEDATSDLEEEDSFKRALKGAEALEDGATNGAGDEDDDDRPNYRIVEDANGGVRYVYDEIDPVYDSDDTDARGGENTIGNIPLSFYDAYPHIGYTIDGKKLMRPAERKQALDSLLESIEIPKGWTGLTDPTTGQPLNLSQDELELLKRVQMNEIPEEGYDPYPDTVEYFTGIEEKMPLSAAPEPKRRFLPSKHEAKRVMKLVRAIREGRIAPYRPPEEREKEDAEEEEKYYDVWQDEQPRAEHVMHIPAPKLPPPGYDMSYNPPPEYVPTKAEREAWEKLEPEDREKEYLPQKYDSLRKVPGYETLVKERFERCLDLYLAPRVRKNRLNIDPNSLLPKLPRPEDLRPFPTVCQMIFRGHDGRVRSAAVDPTGLWLATGGDDGTIRIWMINPSRLVWSVKVSSDEPVSAVRWRPNRDTMVLAAAAGEEVFLMVPPDIDPEVEQASRAVLDAGFGYAATNGSGSNQMTADGKQPAAKWARPGARLEDEGVLLKVTVRSPVKVISWHRRGDHFCTVSPTGQRSSVAVHTLSRHLTQIPFRRLAGLAQVAHFHPTRPLFFVATQRAIRCYDLQRLELVKVVQPGARWISSFDVHPGGDNMVVGSYDRRLLWHDLDLSTRPYKTMRFHPQAIRAVRYHRGGLPLFADASDDGTLQIFHGRVVSDLMENATIVPLKTLRGHRVVDSLGVMDVDWHPTEPWCISAGADGTARLWM